MHRLYKFVMKGGLEYTKSMQRKTELWVMGGVAVLIIVIAILAGIFGGSAPAVGGFTSTSTDPISAADNVRGNTNASVSMIEYGDFECPACGAYEPLVEDITKKYGDRVAFAFRNYPLPQHQDAVVAAQAAEAAGLQGKYWEMHDLLYKNQDTWTKVGPSDVVAKYFDGYAKSIGLDVKKFDTDINSQGVKDKVQKDKALGDAAKVDHTPTFFINAQQIENPTSEADFEKVLDAALGSSAPSSTTDNGATLNGPTSTPAATH